MEIKGMHCGQVQECQHLCEVHREQEERNQEVDRVLTNRDWKGGESSNRLTSLGHLRGCPRNEGARQTRVAGRITRQHISHGGWEIKGKQEQNTINIYIYEKMASIGPSRGCVDPTDPSITLARSSADRRHAGAGHSGNSPAADGEDSHLPPTAMTHIARGGLTRTDDITHSDRNSTAATMAFIIRHHLT